MEAGYYWVQFDDDFGSPGHWVVAECYGFDDAEQEAFYACGYDWGRYPCLIGPKIEPPPVTKAD